ncbi:unnamed protein product [Peronospora destructor]|uniref:Uncharacterized protein n=1 Tax=Peronospora destructor TaxID=86335 RepID=A0AAV0STR1_9STRA|nr:unnamed protein product [Peronospora destructor]
MVASLPPASSSTPDTLSEFDPKTESKLSTAPSTVASIASSPSTVASIASSPSNSESVAVREKKQAEGKAAAEANIQKPALYKRRRDRNSKPKPKPKKKDTALCVGYYIDALDKKMMWGEARIIQCNLKSQKIKVHFVGWSRNHDRWTDVMSIMAHGRYAPRTKDSTVKSWDGDMYLFEDMLGTVDKAAFPPAPPLKENEKQAALSPTLAKEKVDKMTKAPSALRAGHTVRSVLKRKADMGSSRDKAILKRIAATPKVVVSNGPPREHDQRSKHAVAVAKVKAKENNKEKRKLPRSSKRQKGEGKQPSASTTAKARQSAKNGAISADDLPLFRNLELDDGTVMDFSVQREKARKEQEAMRNFIDKCASIWRVSKVCYQYNKKGESGARARR